MVVLILVEEARNEAVNFAEGGQHGQKVVVPKCPLLKSMIKHLSCLFVFAAKETYGRYGALPSVFANLIHITGPPEVLEPRKLLGEAADGAGVLLPGEHGLVRREGVVGEDLARPLNLGPIHRPLLQSINIINAVMRLLLLPVLGRHELLHLGGRGEGRC